MGAAVLPLLAACGGNGQISVKLGFAGSQGPFTPSDQPQFTVTVTNNGPSDAPGVEVRVDLPSSMHYRSSTITGFGNARTQVVDARVGTSQPAWGFWDLAAPASGSDLCESCVAITFTTDLTAPPGGLSISAHAQGDNTSGEVSSDDLKLTVNGAPKLQLSARVQAGTLIAGSTATYAVTITNTGTGPAQGVALLVTLPPVMTWQKSGAFNGNASRSNPIDPVKGSVEAFYSGWTLPAASSGGPGIVTVQFITAVSGGPPTGTYTITAQATDQQGDQVTLTNSAPVQVIGSTPTPIPVPTPSGSAKASPTPGR
ncbi:MAG TPA: hypothetical protein VF155_04000 [Candidatus Dormibacteraeota bacterium]